MNRPTLLMLSALLVAPLGFLLAVDTAGVKVPASFPGEWHRFGRGVLEQTQKTLMLKELFVASQDSFGDCEFKLRARAHDGEEQVQIWVGLRFRDRDSRYVIGLRGGNNNDVYMARYAPDGGIRFLGLAALDFKPRVGTWYDLRILAKGNRFQVYLGDEKLPRLNTVDTESLWKEGGIVLGGGWLKAEFSEVVIKPLAGDSLSAFEAAGASMWQAPEIDREALRAKQRATYKPFSIEKLQPGRNTFSLNGQWLFMPDQSLLKEEKPLTAAYDDAGWHVMSVPALWTPSLAWLQAETGFPKLKGFPEVATRKGISENIYKEEMARLEGYSFDWKTTNGAWYRHRVLLPNSLEGRHFELHFDAIAKVANVWVNGQKVGSHIGMFGEIKCDITQALKPGENVIAVHVAPKLQKDADDGDSVEGVAVTVAVTKKMLYSLPSAIYDNRAAGIWQPVKLVVTAPAFVEDVYVQPNLTGAKVDVTLQNTGTGAAPLELAYTITSKKEGALLSAQEKVASTSLATSQKATLRFETPKLAPKLWTPSEPNLYNLDVRLMAAGKVIDSKTVSFGFRTFSTKGEQLMLNGKPYWLRGANHFPVYLGPNDGAYARGFLQMAHDGNVRATRTVCAPMTTPWLEACDEIGIGVSYEGIWPWLMLKGPPPDPKLLKIWKEDFASLITKYRNHPSLLIWTVNNEMKFPFFDKDNPEMLKKKWTVVTDMIKTMRALDPTRPIVMDSGYLRIHGQYDKIIVPNQFDDGDIDDAHCYFGWYNRSFFHFFKGQFGQEFCTPGRPLISQEMCAGGYARSDDGHPTRAYLFNHYTPQALVGENAYENADPDIFLTRQAFMTKELAETFRRANRTDTAGILHFSYTTWFRNVQDLSKIQPFEVYYAYKTAHAPVLVSAELFGRHTYAGAVLKRRVCVINDSEDASALPASQLTWSIESQGNVLAKGTTPVPPVGYYTNQWMDVEFKMPEQLPTPRVNAQLKLTLESNGKQLSQNSYDLVVTSRQWAQGALADKSKTVALYDPKNLSSSALTGLGLPKIDSLAQLTPAKASVLVVGDVDTLAADRGRVEQMSAYLAAGGKVLLLNAGKNLKSLFPEQIRSYCALAGKSKRGGDRGEIVSLQVPESPVFDGLETLDLAWFEMGPEPLPYACSGYYQIERSRPEVTALAWHLPIHGYLQKPEDVVDLSGSPLVEIQCGTGRLISSEMALESGSNDPIARRLLCNILSYLQGNN